MNLQHLRYFAAVIECGGVVKAAHRMHVSQPAISAALRALEEELGGPLFNRPGGGRHLVPTSKAMRFHARTAEILGLCKSASAEFRTDPHRPPRLRIGALATLAGSEIVSAVTRLRRQRAKWRVEIWEAGSGQLGDWLAQGRIDLAWTAVDANTRNAKVLWREPFVALVALDHRLARYRRTGITLKELDGEQIVLRGSCELNSGELRSAGLSMRSSAGEPMSSSARALRDELALRLVAWGVGIAIAPLSLATPEVVAVPVADLGLSRTIGLQWRPEVPEDGVMAVIDAIEASRLVTKVRTHK